MALERLDITAVRNLAQVGLRDLSQVNVFFGDNGSGKTSVLESVYLLGMAQTFRRGQIKSLISHSAQECAVYGQIRRDEGAAVALGVSRDREGGFQAKIIGETVKAASELAEQLPLQVINSESFNLLSGSPAHRRQFMDWGVFHVEHGFNTNWHRFQRALKQRNSLLRRGKITSVELEPWNRELCESGELVDKGRVDYFADLEQAFSRLIERLSPDLAAIDLRYRRGWDKKISLEESLAAAEATDIQQGFTHVGPQRADLKVVIDGYAAADVLSRGQQKLAVCALKLAQGQLLAGGKRRSCVYLVDDLPAELDRSHCQLVAEVLSELQTQVFITCVEQHEIADVWTESSGGELNMFHVEHGSVESVAAA